MNLSTRARNIQDNGQQINEINLGTCWIKQFWTPNAGTYGHQVLTMWCTYGDIDSFAYDITSGCGYCKKGAGLWAAFRSLGLRVRGVSIENEMDWKYRKGGNYYKVPKKDVMKIRKGEKYSATSAKIDKENE